jgi:MFS family permease
MQSSPMGCQRIFIPFKGIYANLWRLSDMLGQRRMFMIAIAIFGIGSLLGGLPTSYMSWPSWSRLVGHIHHDRRAC